MKPISCAQISSKASIEALRQKIAAIKLQTPSHFQVSFASNAEQVDYNNSTHASISEQRDRPNFWFPLCLYCTFFEFTLGVRFFH